MKQLFFTFLAFGACLCSNVQAQEQQKNPYKTPFIDNSNVESTRSEFLTYRKTSGTKGSPIDTTLSFSPVLDNWETLSNTPNYNEVQTDFIVPFEYLDKSMYMKMGATSGKSTLFVNDSLVGFRLDSRLPVEFNITKFVHRGKNKLRLVTENIHSANEIESPQQLNIAPELYLFAQPKIRVKDILTKVTFNPSYTDALLQIALLVKSELINPHTVTVYYDLFGPDGKLINQEFKNINIGMYKQDTVRFTASIAGVDKWNADEPQLYTVKFRVQREGRFTEFFEGPVGFRTVEIRGNQLLINGKQEQIKGINADMLPELVDVHTSYDSLKKVLSDLRGIGFNAVRTPYPLQSDFYSLCNEIGIYVIETANLNTGSASKSTAKGGTIANDPAWEAIFTDRVVNTIERGKAQPSIIAWSMGENAGNGYNMYQAHLAAKKLDNTRPVVYDGAADQWNSDMFMPNMQAQNQTKKQVTFESSSAPVLPSRLEYGADFFLNPGVMGAFYSESHPTTIEALKAKFALQLPSVLIKLVDRAGGVVEITNNTPNDMNNVDMKSYIYRKGALKYELINKVSIPSGEAILVTIRRIANNQTLRVNVGGIYTESFNNIK